MLLIFYFMFMNTGTVPVSNKPNLKFFQCPTFSYSAQEDNKQAVFCLTPCWVFCPQLNWNNYERGF